MFESEFSSGLDESDNQKQKKSSVGKKEVKWTKKEADRERGSRFSLFRDNPEIPVQMNHRVHPHVEPLFSQSTYDVNYAAILHPHMIANLNQTLGVTRVTSIQEHAIRLLLEGKDAMIRSQTGSGKTLAYAIPILEKLHNIRPKISRSDGLKSLVILPTRELALQTYHIFLKLCKPFTWIVPGILTGGERRKSEKARLRKGITILVGTPGRLLDHAKSTKSLNFRFLEWMVIDEADLLLEMGYEKDITSIMKLVKEQRNEGALQTVLLSATLTDAVEKLANSSLQQQAVRVDPAVDACDGESFEDFIMPDSLEQMFILVPPKLRLVTLASFLLQQNTTSAQNKNEDELDDDESMIVGKILVFMGTQGMVDFHTELFATVLPSINFFKLHGNMSQVERTNVFKSFKTHSNGVLVCSDVASRGLDMVGVEWIVQYTAPMTLHDYVHRIGRTARIGAKGRSLLFLSPHEASFVNLLMQRRVRIVEYKVQDCLNNLLNLNFDQDKKKESLEETATRLQVRFENAVLDQKPLRLLGYDAYVSWARFYTRYPKELRQIFNFKKLHLGHFAKSFALRDPPKVISAMGKLNFKKSEKNKERVENRLSFSKNEGRCMIPPKRKVIEDPSEFGSGMKSKPAKRSKIAWYRDDNPSKKSD